MSRSAAEVCVAEGDFGHSALGGVADLLVNQRAATRTGDSRARGGSGASAKQLLHRGVEFGVFYVRYRERVLAYFSQRVRNPELAADLMAETFARALLAVREAKTGAVPESPVGWLLIIAKNQLVDSARRGGGAKTGRS